MKPIPKPSIIFSYPKIDNLCIILNEIRNINVGLENVECWTSSILKKLKNSTFFFFFKFKYSKRPMITTKPEHKNNRQEFMFRSKMERLWHYLKLTPQGNVTNRFYCIYMSFFILTKYRNSLEVRNVPSLSPQADPLEP